MFQVTVALIDLSPEFSYTSVPHLSPHSFLQAKAKNTFHYAMLAGPSNIFLDNNFIAKVVTVELLITDPPRSDHPLYNGQPLWNGLNLP